MALFSWSEQQFRAGGEGYLGICSLGLVELLKAWGGGWWSSSLSLDSGIICSNGLTWRQQRRFCLTTLRELGLGKQALELQLQHEAAELVKVLHQEQGERKWARASLPIPVLLHTHTHPYRGV